MNSTIAPQKSPAENPANRERCCEKVRDRGMNWPTFHQCKRKAVVKRKGKPYCRIHDPRAVKERRDGQMKAFTSRIHRNVFGGYAPAMFALLKESQKSIGGDWRQRRDELVAKLSEYAPSVEDERNADNASYKPKSGSVLETEGGKVNG